MTVEQAFEMLRQGVDGRLVAAALEPLASGGNEQAQLLLGTMYVEGKSVPRDLVEGYAWLKVASDSIYPPFASHASTLLTQVEPALTGVDLIKADQRVITLRAGIAEQAYETSGPALRQFTSERPAAFSPFIKFDKEVVQLTPVIATPAQPGIRPGCGSNSGRPKDCPAQSRSIPEPRCTGRILQADTRPSTAPTDRTFTRMPTMSSRLRAIGFNGTTIFLAHLDRSGWVCGVTVAQGSGEPEWDSSALRAVATWRLTPAMRQGQPVESLFRFAASARQAN